MMKTPVMVKCIVGGFEVEGVKGEEWGRERTEGKGGERRRGRRILNFESGGGS